MPFGSLDAPSPTHGKKRFKSPSLIINTDVNNFIDDFDDGRVATEVHYESDSADASCEVRVDLIGDNLSDHHPRSYSKRDRNKMNLHLSKQSSGIIGQASRKRGKTPPQLKRGKANTIVQPFMSTTNKRAMELKAKVNT